MLAVVLGLVSLGHMINAGAVNTGTYYQTAGGKCDISMRTCGYVDPGDKTVYIKVNGVTYFTSLTTTTAERAFSFLTLDPSTCKASDYKHFDTCGVPAESNNLANYIYGLADGTTILCIGFDDVFSSLQDTARNALKSIGSTFQQ